MPWLPPDGEPHKVRVRVMVPTYVTIEMDECAHENQEAAFKLACKALGLSPLEAEQVDDAVECECTRCREYRAGVMDDMMDERI